jgi:signal peptidase I
VFQSPLAPDELMVKRVIATPGDLVDARLGRVRIGGHTLAEPYVLRQAATGAIESQLVPPGCYYVLGDNRDDSLDSRSWGVVPREHIVGRARLVLWSSSPGAAEPVAATPRQQASHRFVPRPHRLFKWVE